MAEPEDDTPRGRILPYCRRCGHGTRSIPCPCCDGPACAGCGRCPDCDGPVPDEEE